MYLIDTDILIWVLRGNQKYKDLLQSIKYKGPLSISTVTVAEVYKNLYPSEIVMTEAVLHEFQVADVTMPIAKQGGFYWQQYIRQFKNMSLTDCLIAATAYVHNLQLVTLNVKHFPMKNIKIVDILQ